MDAQDYLDQVVLPLRNRLSKEPFAVDLFFSAAVAKYHLVDWVVDGDEKAVKRARKRIREICPDYIYLHADAITHKHKILEANRELRDIEPFKDLKDVLWLEGPQFLNDGSDNLLLDESGNPLTAPGTAAAYRFSDGEVKGALDVIDATIDAFCKDFGLR